MNKTKKIGIIIILIAIIGSFVIIPMLNKHEIPNEETTPDIAAQFTFSENLGASYGDKIPLSFTINDKNVRNVSLYFDDSLLKVWENPKGKVSFMLNLTYFGLGAKTLNLVSRLSNGTEQSDLRLIRILSDVSPRQLKVNLVKSYEHNPSSFTQGLEFNEGELYESTGLNDQSKVMKVNLENGTIKQEIGLDGTYFGEGITILGNEIFQLTWQAQRCFVYDKKTFQLKKEFSYTGEGWGLCNDGNLIMMSNGTEMITFRDPKTFQIVKTIEVYDQVGPRIRLNELEYIDGKIYANVWMLDMLLEIDPISGKVLSEIDCASIAKEGRGNGEVLNGIAYNPLTDKLYLTGKNWDKLLEVTISE